jgi:hypothetical protein
LSLETPMPSFNSCNKVFARYFWQQQSLKKCFASRL